MISPGLHYTYTAYIDIGDCHHPFFLWESETTTTTRTRTRTRTRTNKNKQEQTRTNKNKQEQTRTNKNKQQQTTTTTTTTATHDLHPTTLPAQDKRWQKRITIPVLCPSRRRRCRVAMFNGYHDGYQVIIIDNHR